MDPIMVEETEPFTALTVVSYPLSVRATGMSALQIH
jgi:hypothetical protein